jgi:hypothetical protein
LDLRTTPENFINNLEVNAKKQEEDLLKSEKTRNFPVFQNGNFQFPADAQDKPK